MPTHFGDACNWLLEKRFGLFVHWGLYAIPAWHEQTLYRILKAVGKWYRAVKESFVGSTPVSHLVVNRDVLLTRRGNALYVHLFEPPKQTSVVLKPLSVLPRRAILLNTGQEVEVRLDLLPSLFRDGNEYLRIRNLPTNEHQDTVLVARLEFDTLTDDQRRQEP